MCKLNQRMHHQMCVRTQEWAVYESAQKCSRESSVVEANSRAGEGLGFGIVGERLEANLQVNEAFGALGPRWSTDGRVRGGRVVGGGGGGWVRLAGSGAEVLAHGLLESIAVRGHPGQEDGTRAAHDWPDAQLVALLEVTQQLAYRHRIRAVHLPAVPEAEFEALADALPLAGARLRAHQRRQRQIHEPVMCLTQRSSNYLLHQFQSGLQKKFE